MKPKIHPKYNPVVFIDVSTGDEIVTKSTVTSSEKREIDGVDHYVVRCDITSFTHPFYTGKLKYVDTAGRIERFRSKFAGTGYASLKRGKKKAPPAESEEG